MFNFEAEPLACTKYTLRRLPLWGEKVRDDEINFQYPSQEIFNSLPASVFLRGLEVSTYHANDNTVSSVLCRLSNKMKSDVIEKGNIQRFRTRSLHFGGVKVARKVQAGDDNGKHYVYGIAFLD